ncbi:MULTISPECIES: sensor histidine kinase [Ramlibacter]|nr:MULTISPECIES: sensor histidine kinase [Ramlibacter]MBA2961672.1 sensor histidine kinase [Ramlibacter sp. CGMCC 1.13660]
MDISDFIEQHVDPIVAEWVEFARSRLPSSGGLSFGELADHAKVLLVAVAADIRQAQGAARRHEKSQGNAPGNAPEITRIARDHAEQRFAQAFSLDQLVAEYRALRASVIRRWTQTQQEVDRGSLEELTRLGESLDQALTESTSLYAKHVDDARNLLLAVLGHDLRTPLGVVHLTANSLLRTDSLDGAQTKAVVRMLTSAERMKAMVNDILDFTQTALGIRLPVSPAPADVGEIAASVAEEVGILHPDSRLEVTREGDCTGNWDGTRVAQMLSNLVSNAVQHGDPSKPVIVRVTGEGEAVTVRVQNEGPHITAETWRTLFTPLRHASDAQKDRKAGSSGLGLGLYIAKEIAVAHGGSVDVSSEGPATTFCVRLPRPTFPA